MRILGFLSVSYDGCASNTYQQLREKWPSGIINEYSWRVDDTPLEELQQYITFLESKGVRSLGCHPKPLEHYWLKLDRHYENEELHNFRWFTFQALPQIYGSITVNGAHCRKERCLTPKFQMGSVTGCWDCPVVSEAFRAILETAGLSGLAFGCVDVLDSRDRKIENPPVTLYRLMAIQMMPPVASPPCVLTDGFGAPYTGDPNRGLLQKDGDFRHPEEVYSAKDLLALHNCDIAFTHEHWGTPRVQYPSMVYSHRFREVLLKHKIKGSWFPVHVIDD